MNFITFHAQRRASGALHAHATLADLDNATYVRMVDMMFASAARHHPNIQKTLLTSASTDLSLLQTSLVRVDNAVKTETLMRDRAAAQAHFLAAYDFTQPAVLLDSDILIFGSLTPLFERDFDIAVTWRHRDGMPINNGLILINKRRPETVRTFFRRYVDIYNTRYAGAADWYGDQLAMHDAVGCKAEDLSDNTVVDAAGCRVLLLPCSQYNFTPGRRLRKLLWPARSRRVFHFKGARKPQMFEFWDLHFSGRPKLLALLQIWIRRTMSRLPKPRA